MPVESAAARFAFSETSFHGLRSKLVELRFLSSSRLPM